ncbi:uncharacterized protein EDB93DRAFT_1134840, partial [Suillus bovinus]|uniref:uncharacterized protein n=1 Tax=Suillus bovinus TaxID=48563 RepID=UPI001B87ABCE
FASPIVFAIITALASSISATSDTAGHLCIHTCYSDIQCVIPACNYHGCWQAFFFCMVSRVFALTSVQYGR